MATLLVQNVHDDLYAWLLRLAQLHRRFLDAAVIALLEWAVAQADRKSVAALSSICRRPWFDSARVGAPDSTRLLREDRDR